MRLGLCVLSAVLQAVLSTRADVPASDHLTLSGRSGDAQASTETGSTLVLYAYDATERPSARTNLEFFVNRGLITSDKATFVFVSRDWSGFRFPAQGNVHVIEAETVVKCHTLGSWREGFAYAAQKLTMSDFAHVFLIASAIRGPFMPGWAADLNLNWLDVFLAQMLPSAYTAVVGSTMKCGEGESTKDCSLNSVPFMTAMQYIHELHLLLDRCPWDDASLEQEMHTYHQWLLRQGVEIHSLALSSTVTTPSLFESIFVDVERADTALIASAAHLMQQHTSYGLTGRPSMRDFESGYAVYLDQLLPPTRERRLRRQPLIVDLPRVNGSVTVLESGTNLQLSPTVKSFCEAQQVRRKECSSSPCNVDQHGKGTM